MKEEVSVVPSHSRTSAPSSISSGHVEHENSYCGTAEDLFVPGTPYYIKKNMGAENCLKSGECFTLLRRHQGEHFQRILISSNIILDHKRDSHYYARGMYLKVCLVLWTMISLNFSFSFAKLEYLVKYYIFSFEDVPAIQFLRLVTADELVLCKEVKPSVVPCSFHLYFFVLAVKSMIVIVLKLRVP